MWVRLYRFGCFVFHPIWIHWSRSCRNLCYIWWSICVRGLQRRGNGPRSCQNEFGLFPRSWAWRYPPWKTVTSGRTWHYKFEAALWMSRRDLSGTLIIKEIIRMKWQCYTETHPTSGMYRRGSGVKLCSDFLQPERVGSSGLRYNR